jgi:hypothetical protein
LVGETTSAALKIEAAWPRFLSSYESYDAALRKIVKSALTEKIKAADAARKIEVVAHTYGNVAVKPINEETSAIYKAERLWTRSTR